MSPHRENCATWFVHPAAHWLCVSGSHPLSLPHCAVLQVHAGKTAPRWDFLHITPSFFPTPTSQEIRLCFRAAAIHTSLSFCFPPETQVPDSVESYRGHPRQQLCVHWPHPATIRSRMGVSQRQLAIWWAPSLESCVMCTDLAPIFPAICHVWHTTALQVMCCISCLRCKSCEGRCSCGDIIDAALGAHHAACHSVLCVRTQHCFWSDCGHYWLTSFTTP